MNAVDRRAGLFVRGRTRTAGRQAPPGRQAGSRDNPWTRAARRTHDEMHGKWLTRPCPRCGFPPPPPAGQVAGTATCAHGETYERYGYPFTDAGGYHRDDTVERAVRRRSTRVVGITLLTAGMIALGTLLAFLQLWADSR